MRFVISADGLTVTDTTTGLTWTRDDASPKDANHSEAQAAVEALTTVAALVEALKRLEVAANTVSRCYTHRPENFAAALQGLREDAESARAALRAAGVEP